MKKIILTFLMLLTFCFSATAQQYYYKAQSFALATVHNGYYSWGEWQKSNITFKLDLTNDVIVIYTKAEQIYKVVDVEQQAINDSGGGTQITFYVLNQDYLRGTIRLRVQADGTSQLYVDFNDMAWVYGSVVRIK